MNEAWRLNRAQIERLRQNEVSLASSPPLAALRRAITDGPDALDDGGVLAGQFLAALDRAMAHRLQELSELTPADYASLIRASLAEAVTVLAPDAPEIAKDIGLALDKMQRASEGKASALDNGYLERLSRAGRRHEGKEFDCGQRTRFRADVIQGVLGKDGLLDHCWNAYAAALELPSGQAGRLCAHLRGLAGLPSPSRDAA